MLYVFLAKTFPDAGTGSDSTGSPSAVITGTGDMRMSPWKTVSPGETMGVPADTYILSIIPDFEAVMPVGASRRGEGFSSNVSEIVISALVP